jgi:hypothetical protein
MDGLLQQIGLSVIDKLFLGAAALGVGYVLNRRLEVFRSRRALEGEFLRERTRRLDELYVAMLDVEAAARQFVGLELERIEAGKGLRGFITTNQAEIRTAFEKFMETSQTLTLKAANYRPWISDRLQALCAEYEKVVRAGITEETVAGSHDMDEIGRLRSRTSYLQNAIVAAIREGAPPTAV